VVVDRIVDIVEDRATVKSAASRPAVLYSVVIAGRVTEMLDISAILRTSGMGAAKAVHSATEAVGSAN